MGLHLNNKKTAPDAENAEGGEGEIIPVQKDLI